MFCKRKNGKKESLSTNGCIKRQKGNGINYILKMQEFFFYAVVFLATSLIINNTAVNFAFAFLHWIYKTCTLKKRYINLKN